MAQSMNPDDLRDQINQIAASYDMSVTLAAWRTMGEAISQFYGGLTEGGVPSEAATSLSAEAVHMVMIKAIWPDYRHGVAGMDADV